MYLLFCAGCSPAKPWEVNHTRSSKARPKGPSEETQHQHPSSRQEAPLPQVPGIPFPGVRSQRMVRHASTKLDDSGAWSFVQLTNGDSEAEGRARWPRGDVLTHRSSCTKVPQRPEVPIASRFDGRFDCFARCKQHVFLNAPVQREYDHPQLKCFET